MEQVVEIESFLFLPGGAGEERQQSLSTSWVQKPLVPLPSVLYLHLKTQMNSGFYPCLF